MKASDLEQALNTLMRIGFWLALAFAFVMASLPNPPDLVETSDKFQHMAAFATLALIGALAFPGMPLLALGIGLFCFGGLIEVVQMIPALHRDAELLDLAADGAAIVMVLLPMAAARRFLGRQARA